MRFFHEETARDLSLALLEIVLALCTAWQRNSSKRFFMRSRQKNISARQTSDSLTIFMKYLVKCSHFVHIHALTRRDFVIL